MSAGFSSLDLWEIPAGPPPPGKVPNLIDPPSQAPILSIGIYVLLPLLVPFVVMRLYTRLRLTRAFGIDDLLCIASTVLILAYAGVLLALLNLKPITPLGRHIWDIPVAAFTSEYLELIIMALVTNPAAAMFVKLTILTLYFRIFQPSRWAHHLILAGSIAVAVFYLVTIITLLALCVPSRGETWLAKASFGTCPTVQVRIARSQGFFGLFSDVFILVIPLWQVSQLSLPPKRKAGVMLVFFTGLL
ncbi:hypothetical protein INS49_009085 [Diaporthe citri]|uniref:uncharacterized protein n=1 Tax=Diaporthe citri TaxID=83186 RepID=UPI001C7F305A|nr:uncharacterized protein INS49_009085 [Diaporthe citri]KAG6363982.1 hypothetical protein INS49_009085 [Diaporthe citri]